MPIRILALVQTMSPLESKHLLVRTSPLSAIALVLRRTTGITSWYHMKCIIPSQVFLINIQYSHSGCTANGFMDCVSLVVTGESSLLII